MNRKKPKLPLKEALYCAYCIHEKECSSYGFASKGYNCFEETSKEGFIFEPKCCGNCGGRKGLIKKVEVIRLGLPQQNEEERVLIKQNCDGYEEACLEKEDFCSCGEPLENKKIDKKDVYMDLTKGETNDKH